MCMIPYVYIKKKLVVTRTPKQPPESTSYTTKILYRSLRDLHLKSTVKVKVNKNTKVL